MKQAKFLKLTVAVLVVIFIGLGSFFLGDKHGVESMRIKRVTPTEIAQAMKDDHFWRTYRENTLLVTGTLSSVNKTAGDLVIGFKTDSTYGALCDLGNSNQVLHVGERISALGESGPAQRQPSAVLLKGCVIP